jgi:hypothetical protein
MKFRRGLFCLEDEARRFLRHIGKNLSEYKGPYNLGKSDPPKIFSVISEETSSGHNIDSETCEHRANGF